MTQIVRHGEVRRGRLGIEMVDLTPELARKFGVSSLDGAVIAGVQPGSPAERAGLREGDVITALSGRPIRSAAELRARLGLTAVGEEVELRVSRDGATRTVRVQIAAPQDQTSGEGQPVAQLPGMRVVEIERGSPLYRRVQGLIVSAVERNSAAWQAGLRPADIIYGVNRRRVRTFAEFQSALGAGEGGFSISLLRGDATLTITVR
jgi:serine protease Do/serine protease DegQ